MIANALTNKKDFIVAKAYARGVNTFEEEGKESEANADEVPAPASSNLHSDIMRHLRGSGPKCFYFFNAFSILRHLFAKHRGDYVSRFTEHGNFAVRVPGLTPHRIINEVEFYRISNPFLDPVPSSNMDFSEVKCGVLIGTDYDFQHNLKLREYLLA